MEVKKYEDELLNILESNIQNKELYVKTLADQYPEHKETILANFSTWNDLSTLDIAAPSSKMDQAFYESMSNMEIPSAVNQTTKVVSISDSRSKLFTLQRLGIAMTFLVGLALGGYLDFFSPGGNMNNNGTAIDNSGLVRFASLEQMPHAGDRIKGIINTKGRSNLDAKILHALNEVICNDPNTNVRLTAIETLVTFWDSPAAREILIKSIPYQESPTVQLELADIMISLEAKSSSDKWNQLLSSTQVEPDIKSQLEQTLKEIL